ncbi:retrotransposon protein, putative, ty1-copia subclass [Tanacetum coccineum]
MVVRSDRGGEYVAPFAELCAKHGIRHEFTAPYSPQQNGIAERKNRTLKEMIPRKEKEETPYELWMGRKPSYQYLRVWGCLAKVAVPTPKAQKIGPKSVDCIFIGYAKNSTAYRTGSSSRLDDKVLRDKRQRDDNDLQIEMTDQTEEEEVKPRRSKRARNEKSFGPDFVSFMVENEPTSYREAVTSSEGQQWREAIKSEIESIYKPYVGACGFTSWFSDKMIRSTKDMLKSKFDMKDMGLADVILGIKIIRSQNGLVLSQAHYVDKILNTHNTEDSSQARTPIDTSLHQSKNRGLAKSTIESEFIALDKCGEEAEWLRQFVEDIPSWPKPVTAISIHCDSKSAMGRAKSTMYNGKFRHIRRRHNSIRQLLSTGVISIDYVVSKDNIADQFTKGLSRELVSKSSKGMGLKPLKE